MSPKRGVAVVVLVLALVLAAPAHAASLSGWSDVPTLLHSAWQWLDNLLPGAGGGRVRAYTNALKPSAIHEKSTAAVDPNGNRLTTTPPPCETGCDRGAGVDPNG